MELVKKALFCLLLLAITITGFSQARPVYVFWQDDSVVKKQYYGQALDNKNAAIASFDKEQKKNYKEIYERRFDEVGSLLKSERTVTEPVVHEYLQKIIKRIVDANPELKPLTLRVFFTRDFWPNAYSMGEGTIAFNAGLFAYLNNESELAFILCHELAHLYLDHAKKRIDKIIAITESDSLKKELKRLSKTEYRIGEEYSKLMRFLAFDIKRHSREGEAEADRVGLRFFSRTGFNGNGFISAMNVLDKIDDTTLLSKPDIARWFSFQAYPFKEKWVKKASAIFGAMNTEDTSSVSKAEKDSLKTHPDCTRRIELLKDSALVIKGGDFLVNEKLFRQLKEAFIPEIVEQVYKDGNISRNLYLSLGLLQDERFKPLAIFSVARDLNSIYKLQKSHELGLTVDTESRFFSEEYNRLLRMIDRLRLSEIAELTYQFCAKYESEMKDYSAFEEAFQQAKKNKAEQQ